MDKPRIVVIVGPTAAGKTALAVSLAVALDGEIISADSMQVYRGMDIGTAKPTADERRGVPHHLIDVVPPDTDYTAGRFMREARAAVADITSRGRNAVVAGGTGLYVRALLEGLVEGPASDPQIRARLLEEAEIYGPASLYERLREVDPESAASVHPNNLRRVVRALEVFEATARPISALHSDHAFSDRPYDALKIGVTLPREELYRRIDARVDEMVERGLLGEVRSLMEFYSTDLKPMCGLGYKEMAAHVAGAVGFDEAVRLIKRNTRHYAKRQMTWFRKDSEITWLHPDQTDTAVRTARAHLAGAR